MPGPEVLNMPGRRDGQTKMVRDGNTVSGKKNALKNRTSSKLKLIDQAYQFFYLYL